MPAKIKRFFPCSAWIEDNTTWLMYRGCPWKCPGNERIGMAMRFYLFSFQYAYRFSIFCERKDEGPFEAFPFPLFDFRAEDPFLWRDKRGNFHCLFHGIDGNGGFRCYLNGTGCDVGRHAFSSDGLRWRVSLDRPAYSTTIQWSNGDMEILNRRERPQLLFHEKTREILMLVNGAQSMNVPKECNEKSSNKNLRCPSFTIGTLLE